MRRRVRTHLDGLRLEAHRTERQFPSVMACNLELAVQVAGFSDVVALVYGTCQRYGVTVRIINFSCNLRFGNNSQEQEHQCNEKRPFHVCFILIYPIIDFEYTSLCRKTTYLLCGCKVTYNSLKKVENFLPFNIFLLILHLCRMIVPL